jgi:hypothetical protein
MKKNPGLVALLGALAQQTRQRGGSPSVQEIEASARHWWASSWSNGALFGARPAVIR